MVAVAWEAYNISGSPSALAYVGVATSAPQVAFLLLGGATSDRLSRRSVLFIADLVRAGTVGALALLVRSGPVGLFQLCAAGALVGAATAFASPAFDALVPQIVPAEELVDANAIDQFVRPGALQLAGPAIGGAAVAALRPAGCFALDAASFVFCALCVGRMATQSRPRPRGSVPSLRQDISEGMGYVRQHAWLWATFVSATLAYLLFIGPTQVLLPYIVRYGLHRGASAYGTVLAVGGFGALLGALLSSRKQSLHNGIAWAYIFWALATLAVAGYGIATSTAGLAAAALVVNGAEAAGAVVWGTLKQRRVPNAMLGRVSSIDWCISTASLPLSYALTAPVAHLVGARETLVLAGVLGAAVTFAFLYVPGVRSRGAQEGQLAGLAEVPNSG